MSNTMKKKFESTIERLKAHEYLYNYYSIEYR